MILCRGAGRYRVKWRDGLSQMTAIYHVAEGVFFQ